MPKASAHPTMAAQQSACLITALLLLKLETTVLFLRPRPSTARAMLQSISAAAPSRAEFALLTAHPDAAGALLPRMHRVRALSRTTYAPPRCLAANRPPSSWQAHRDRRCPRAPRRSALARLRQHPRRTCGRQERCRAQAVQGPWHATRGLAHVPTMIAEVEPRQAEIPGRGASSLARIC